MHIRLVPPLALLLALTMTGCFYSREIAQVEREIERAYPDARLDREVMVSLGPLSLRTLRWVAGWGSGEEVRRARTYLRDISRIKVGVYEASDLPALEGFEPARLRRLERQGWEVAVKVQEEDERVWVLYRERRGSVRDLYVVVLNEEEFVVARLRGRLGRLLERVLADEGALRSQLSVLSDQ